MTFIIYISAHYLIQRKQDLKLGFTRQDVRLYEMYKTRNIFLSLLHNLILDKSLLIMPEFVKILNCNIHI